VVVFDELACALELFVDGSVPEEIAYPVPEEAAKTGFTEALGTNTGAGVHRIDCRDSTFEQIQRCELGSSLGEIIKFSLGHVPEEWRISKLVPADSEPYVLRRPVSTTVVAAGADRFHRPRVAVGAGVLAADRVRV
jgi:hypothetical protein